MKSHSSPLFLQVPQILAMNQLRPGRAFPRAVSYWVVLWAFAHIHQNELMCVRTHVAISAVASLELAGNRYFYVRKKQRTRRRRHKPSPCHSIPCLVILEHERCP
jgi:hypothetical protein